MKRTIAPVALALIGSVPAHAQPGWEDGYGHMMWGGGFGLLSGLMMLVFWGAIIAAVVLGRSLADGAGLEEPASRRARDPQGAARKRRDRPRGVPGPAYGAEVLSRPNCVLSGCRRASAKSRRDDRIAGWPVAHADQVSQAQNPR